MAKKTINLGTGELTGDGESIRSAFGKINDNFDELYAKDATDFDGDYNSLTNKPTIPADVSDLTDSTGLLSSGTGDITFAATTISAPNQDEIVIQSKDSNGFGTARVNLNSEFGGDARLRAFSSESVDTFTLANGDFTTGVWQDNGFGNGVVSFTGAQGIGDFFQNTLFKLTPDNVSIAINDGTPFIWNGGANGAGTDTPGFGTNPIVPATPITITSIVFRYRSESFISVNYDNQEIRLNVQNGGIVFDANNTIQMFGDSNIELQSGSDFSISSGQNINIGTGSADSISLSTGDLNFTAFDDVNFRGSDSFRLRNTSTTQPIRIITDDNNTQKTWAFNVDGTLTFPDGSLALTNSVLANGLDADLKGSVFADDSTVMVDGVSGVLRANVNVPSTWTVTTGDKTWTFSDTGNLTVPGDIHGAPVISGGAFPSQVGRTVNITPADDASDKKFKFRIDQYGETFTRAYLEFPTAEVDKQVAAVFPHTNGKAGYIYTQGADTNGQGMNDAFNIFYNSGDIKITSMGLSGGLYTWKFGDSGDLTIPGDIQSEEDISIRINLADSTTRIWRFGEDGSLTTPGGYIKPDATDGFLTIEGPLYADMVQEEGGGVRTITNGVKIRTHRAFDDIDRDWNFSWDGAIYAPRDASNNQVGAIEWRTDNVTSQVRRTEGGTLLSGRVVPPGLMLFSNNTGAVSVLTGNSNYWTFEDNGDLTIPGGIRSDGNINIDINLSDSTLRRWSFGEDGSLTLAGPITNLRTNEGKIALGFESGLTNQGGGTVAVGQYSGRLNQGGSGVAVGGLAGNTDQGASAVAVGALAGGTNQGVAAVAVGALAGGDDQGQGAVAVGQLAGGVRQGEFAIAIGTSAGTTDQPANSIILNASGVQLNGSAAGLYIDPVRNIEGGAFLNYNISTKEIGWSNDISSESDISININLSDSTQRTWRFGEDGNLNLAGNLQFSDGAEIRDVNGDLRLRAAPGDVAQLQGLTTDGAVDAAVKAFHDIETGSFVTINTNIDAGAPEHVWTFDYNGKLTLPGILELANGAQIFNTVGVDDSITIGATGTPGTTTFNGSGFFNSDVYFNKAIQEKFISLQDATGVVTHDCANGHIFYHASPDANWTVNLTNFSLVTNYATAVTIIISQGGTGYYPSALQIGGAAQTINWQGNTTPTPSTNRVDVVTFSIFLTGSGYTVLGQLTGF